MIKNNNENNLCGEKKVKSKILYSCTNIIDLYDYKEMLKYFSQYYWSLVIRGTVFNLILLIILIGGINDLISVLGMFLILQIIILYLSKLKLNNFDEKAFSRMHNGQQKIEVKHEFYDNFFIVKGKMQTFNIPYTEVERSIETKSNFYIYTNKINTIVIIKKSKCDLELISFIRESLINLENHLGNNSGFKGINKYNNPRFVRVFMIILFIVTIASLWGGIISLSILDKINPQNDLNFTKNTWVLWCWIPIPITSIILGYKYKNAGYKCFKNIVAGFIVGILLLIMGSFCLTPTFAVEYNKINEYKDFIDASLPENGELEIRYFDGYIDKDKTNYSVINVYYDKENVTELVSSIEKNNNWILSNEIKSELKIFIPSMFEIGTNIYYSIYNKNTNEYNKLPFESSNYEIYAMKYDKDNKKLEIHSFTYLYN